MRFQRGGILIEVLLTVVIMATTLVLIIQSLAGAYRGTVQATDTARVLMSAHNHMAQQRAGMDGEANQQGRFSYRLAEKNVYEGIRHVELTVEWDDQSRSFHTWMTELAHE